MKTIKNLLTFLFVACGVAFYSSCENDVYDPTHVDSTKDLTAPENFDWKLTRSVSYTIISPVNTVISIYTDNSNKDKSTLAEGIALTANEKQEISLEIPAKDKKIYVQYPTANGEKAIEVDASQASTRASKELVLPSDAVVVDDIGFLWRYYPAKDTKGTLMFEDRYPEKGDYDFNDFVIGYNVETFYSRGNLGETRDGFNMTFQIRALGGSLPYRPALRLKGFAMKNLKGADIQFSSTRSGIDMKLLENRGDDEDVIFIITGTEKLRNGSFYNTYPDNVDTNLPEVSCKVIRNNKNEREIAYAYAYLSSDLPSYFDFFLQHTGNNDEIHFKGFGPTDLSSQDPNTIFAEKGKNLVWAIAIPELINHPQELIDILDVYPSFQGWVSSGGANGADWYKKKPHDKVIVLN